MNAHNVIVTFNSSGSETSVKNYEVIINRSNGYDMGAFPGNTPTRDNLATWSGSVSSEAEAIDCAKQALGSRLNYILYRDDNGIHIGELGHIFRRGEQLVYLRRNTSDGKLIEVHR